MTQRGKRGCMKTILICNHYNSVIFSRFVDKQHKLKNLKNAQKQQDEKFNDKFEKFINLENLKASILKSRSRNALLQQLIKEKRVNIQKLNETKKENHDKNRAQRIILPKYADKVNKLGEYVLEAVEKNEYLALKSKEQLEQLKNLRRNNIEKLTKFIFPISSKTSVIHSRKASNESLLPEAVNELAEAMSTISHDSFDAPREYMIIAPSLPADGNYQECVDWIRSSKEGTVANAPNASVAAEPGQVINNNAYRIAAGLTFIAQIVQALSFYLDVRLPHKVNYNDFCTMGLNERQFKKKVARLNLNVLYLCYTQNISIGNIQPARTVENMIQLLDVKNMDLGRTGPIQTSQRSIDSIMQSFTDILDEEHSDSDEDDSEESLLQKDWENVGNLPMLEVVHSVMIPQQATASMAGTIINNVAHSLSFWKWK